MAAHQVLIFAAIAQVALTFFVAFLLFARRVAEMKQRRIHPQKMATSVQSAQVMQDIRASDNFKHLFEVPVLFYFLCACLLSTHTSNIYLSLLAWVFVGLRYVHSYIQCTHNTVMWRFYAFAASSLTLLLMWVIFAVDQIGQAIATL
jgi:hypothetical protein